MRVIHSNILSLQGTLLDIGCGQMPYREILLEPNGCATRYIGLDLEGRDDPDIVWKDGKIPLEDESVDSALCTEVLEHVPEPVPMLREVYQVLKPGGKMLFTTPFLWPLHEVPYDEYRYTPFALQRIFRECGFSEVEIHALGGWNASMAQMLGLWARRAPMNRYLKRLVLVAVYPLFRLLIALDRPEKVDFEKSPMITGTWGMVTK